MKSVIMIEHGRRTCAVRPGEHCIMLGERALGTIPVCLMFPGTDLKEEAGWLIRCDACIKMFVPVP
jgi:hypothetical protein